MRDREDRSPVFTSDIMEQEDNGDDGSRGRSRGRRRTAKEIAQMFEQLKQRHIARKREWQNEKEELLKQAALADESKRILVDLKKILEELRVELRSEEKKRIDAQSDHARMREIWNAEKDELLRIIRSLETHSSHSQNQHLTSNQAIDSLKQQIAAQERHLSEMELSNAELRIKMREQQRFFNDEKTKLMDSHEGERRNWDKAKQVMLEKIESLQEESRQLQSGAFPLHGSHVVSDDVYLTSPITDERSSANEDKGLMHSPGEGAVCVQSCDNSRKNSREETKYNHFQKTVDEALKQIEKISQDLNTIEVEGENKSGSANRSTPLNSNVTKSIVSSRSPRPSSKDRFQASPKITNQTPSPFENKGKAYNERKISVTSQEDGDVAGCSRQSELVSAKSVASSDAGEWMRGRSNSCKVKASSKLPTRRSSYQTTHVTSGVDSPLIASPPTSCSVPGFTESGTDSGPPETSAGSPQQRGTSKAQRTKSEVPMRNEVKRRQLHNSPTDFVKVEKRYSTPKDYKPGSLEKSSVKKLPNLHQKLLFHNAERSGHEVHESPQPLAVKHSKVKEEIEQQTSVDHSPSFDPTKGIMRSKYPSSPRMQHRTTSSPKISTGEMLGVPKNLPENHIVRSGGQDNQNNFVEAPGNDKKGFPFVNVEEAPPPPVRPKPSITIEKDASGNVLRVITDPRFQRQGSPHAPGDVEADFNPPVSMTTRRRRSSGNLKEATGFHSPLGRNVEALDGQESGILPRQEKTQKEKSGKNWIRKKLSFLDTPKDSEEKGKSPDHKNGSKSRGGRTRSSSLRRADKDRNGSSSDSSDVDQGDKNRTRIKRKGKKGSPNADEKETTKGPKSRMKRYTRSKTDNSLEMKNLFSRFRQSQFSQKKPSIVKQFERKLLENEIKALEDKNAEETASTISEGKSSRGSRKVREGDEEGYSGEDELDGEINSSLNEKKQDGGTVTTTASLTLSKVSPVNSSQSDPRRKSLPGVLPKPRLHTSMVDLRWAGDAAIREAVESPGDKPTLQPNSTTPTSDENRSVTNLVGKFDTKKSRNGGSFIRGAPGRFSLKQEELRQYRRNAEGINESSNKSVDFRKPKRLSWVTDIQDGDHSTPSWRDKIIANEEEPKKSCAGNPPGRRKMSEDMLKKKLNLEKILTDGPRTPRNRRYKRSETQPIEATRRSDESEEDRDIDADLVRDGIGGFWNQNSSSTPGINRSTSLQEFAEETQHESTPPSLQSRFKRPSINNRRPTRWQRKKDH